MKGPAWSPVRDRQDELVMGTQFLDHAEDIVPAPGIQSGGGSFSSYRISSHFECGRIVSISTVGADGARIFRRSSEN